MQKNLYFRNVLRRENIAKAALFDFCLKVASFPRLLLEVFIRKNFGERYFSFASAISVAVILLILPVLFYHMPSFSYDYYNRDNYGTGYFWLHYGTWYLFDIAFVYFAYQRRQEIRRNASVFDFGKFSLYTGDIDKRFYGYELFGKPNSRMVEIFFEPALFFGAGLPLILFGQRLGFVLIVSAVFYALSYAAAYKKGDDFVMDKIDEMIMNEELQSAFVEDVIADETRGVRFYARKPSSKKLREKLSKSFVEKDAADEPITYAE